MAKIARKREYQYVRMREKTKVRFLTSYLQNCRSVFQKYDFGSDCEKAQVSSIIDEKRPKLRQDMDE